MNVFSSRPPQLQHGLRPGMAMKGACSWRHALDPGCCSQNTTKQINACCMCCWYTSHFMCPHSRKLQAVDVRPILFTTTTGRLSGQHWSRHIFKYKGKPIPLQALTGPEGSRRLGLPDFKTIGTWRWQGCQSSAPAAFTHRKYSWYSFLLEAWSTPGP
jgi:hypothetical protein